MAKASAQEDRPASASAAQDALGEGSHVDGVAADGRGNAAVAGSLRTAFLDVDEVLCIGQAEACLQLSRTLARGEVPSPQQLAALFSPVARNALAVAHRRSGGMKYVISSSWREHFSREQMVSVLRGGGLCFVADHLHEGEAWRCLPKSVYRERRAEILHWLSTHHRGETFVVLDDHHSAGQLAVAHHFPDSVLFGRVILCTPGVGLTMEHVDGVVGALRHPMLHDGKTSIGLAPACALGSSDALPMPAIEQLRPRPQNPVAHDDYTPGPSHPSQSPRQAVEQDLPLLRRAVGRRRTRP
jgi:hypothetical protein